MNSPELELWSFTFRRSALPELARAAADAGFAAVTLTPQLFARSDAPDDLRRQVEDAGVRVTFVDGTLSLASNGDYSYAPSAAEQSLGLGAVAADTFTYMVNDGGGGLQTAQLVVEVTGLNDAPDALDTPVSTGENSVLTGLL